MNKLCEILEIAVPSLEDVKDHPQANAFAMLLVTLLESGEPMSLEAVAERFESAGVTSKDKALASLKRCRPGRPPVYREGDDYHLDPHDDDLDLWVFRLGLRPPKYAEIEVEELPPIPGPDVPLTSAELEEAWSGAWLSSWSAQRLAVAIIDAAAQPVEPDAAVELLSRLAKRHDLRRDAPFFRQKKAAVEILDDGRWSIKPGQDAVRAAARRAVRARIESSRRYRQPDPDVVQAHRERIERDFQARRAKLASARRGVVVAYPEAAPRWVVIADLATETVTTLNQDKLANVADRLLAFDILAGVNVRTVLRALEIDPGARRLAELRPPQKTATINDYGKTMALTTAKLITGSCGIRRPLGTAKQLANYLESGQATKLQARLEANAIALCALYRYGILHGAVRLRWPGYAMMIPVPWSVHGDPGLFDLMSAAIESDLPLEVVVGSAPAWGTDPFTNSQVVRVFENPRPYERFLLDEWARPIDISDVQRARIVAELH